MRRRGLPEPSPVVFPMTESPRAVQRKPWQAALLSLLLPGLGQVYNGQARKAALLYCLYWLVGLACLVTMLEFSLAPLNIALPTGIFLASYLFILVDAIKTALSTTGTIATEMVSTVVLLRGSPGALSIRDSPHLRLDSSRGWARHSKYPLRRWKRPCLLGSYAINCLTLMPPQRQDIVFSSTPGKRIVLSSNGLLVSGDRVHLHGRQVYVNDQLLHEPYAHHIPVRGRTFLTSGSTKKG